MRFEFGVFVVRLERYCETSVECWPSFIVTEFGTLPFHFVTSSVIEAFTNRTAW